jgi:hypothetical protein
MFALHINSPVSTDAQMNARTRDAALVERCAP